MGRELSSSTTASRIKESINHIITRAIRSGVKTVHIEPGRNYILVRFRKGTKLEVASKLPKDNAQEFSAQIKQLADLDINKTSIPQHGLAKIDIAGKPHEVQVVTLPVLDGEKITIDILETIEPTQSLETIGLWGEPLRQVQEILALSHGLTLITSPHLKPAQDMLGTMFTLLDNHSHSLIYIGPANSRLPLSVGAEDSDNLIEKLKSLHRGKYTVIGIGLVDNSTLARQINDLVANQQHIMAVLPATSAISALSFWQQMVGEPLTLPTVINQHKVLSLCKNCAESYEPPIIEQIQLAQNFQTDNPDVMKAINALEKSAIKASLGKTRELSSSPKKVLKLWRSSPSGCKHCNFTGYMADIGIFEVCEPGDKLRIELGRQNTAAQLQNIAAEQGMISLKTDAFIKALRGLIDFKTLISICSITG